MAMVSFSSSTGISPQDSRAKPLNFGKKMISNCFGFVQNCFCSCCHYYYSVDFIIAQGDLDLVYFSYLPSAEITSLHIELQSQTLRCG